MCKLFVFVVDQKLVKILTLSYLLMDLIKNIKDLIIGDRSNTEVVSSLSIKYSSLFCEFIPLDKRVLIYIILPKKNVHSKLV